ncbi:MAG: hypothetical protein COB46_11710 [Rhodospirillaceae bacterium]|nr:MAG: hypothetical protein COB46_11710 [Rhodospirillaceae bacterium]
MGLPIDRFVVGANSNDILIRFIETGEMVSKDVFETSSPSMDIQISSNFERFMFEMLDRDASALSALMDEFKTSGNFSVSDTVMDRIRDLIDGERFDDEAVSKLIGKVHADSGYLLDPHSAIGIGAAGAKRGDQDVPIVALATAHPAKFPDVVKAASNVHPDLPDFLADLHDRPERSHTLENDYNVIKGYIEDILKGRGKL